MQNPWRGDSSSISNKGKTMQRPFFSRVIKKKHAACFLVLFFFTISAIWNGTRSTQRWASTPMEWASMSMDIRAIDVSKEMGMLFR
jgi:hypothetical protein